MKRSRVILGRFTYIRISRYGNFTENSVDEATIERQLHARRLAMLYLC